MNLKRAIIPSLIVALLGAVHATAQVIPQPGPPTPIGCAYNTAPVTLNDGQAGWVQCTNAGKIQVDASVTASASITGFPGASPTTGTPISVTTGGVTGTLPSGTVVVASNVGATNNAYCKLGASATTADQPLAPGGGWFAFTVGAATQLTCITSTSTTTVNMVGGSGLPTGVGGAGAGGGGGGGAVTVADGADVTQGALADTACATDNGSCTAQALAKRTNQRLTSAIAALGSPLQAGGAVTTNPTTPANWGLGAFAAAMPANGQALGIYDGTNLVRAMGDETSGLWVNIKAGAGSGGTALADEAAFTQGTTNTTPAGCLFTSSVTNLTSGQAGVVRCTNDRQLLVSDAALLTSVGAVGDTAWVSGNGSVIAVLKGIAGSVTGSTPAGTNTIGTVGQLPYPVGATPITASNTGTTAATTATLAGTSGKTTYLCSYSIRANATAATTVTNTITGVITATLSHIMWVAPAASGLGVDEQIFNPCVPASGTNQAIAVVSGAPGTGGLVSATATGYQL